MGGSSQDLHEKTSYHIPFQDVNHQNRTTSNAIPMGRRWPGKVRANRFRDSDRNLLHRELAYLHRAYLELRDLGQWVECLGVGQDIGGYLAEVNREKEGSGHH